MYSAKSSAERRGQGQGGRAALGARTRRANIDPKAKVREVLIRFHGDLYEAFQEIVQNEARLSETLFVESVAASCEDDDDISLLELESLFRQIGPDSEGLVTLEQFMDFFEPRGASSTRVTRPTNVRSFEEVLFDCRDESGESKFLQIPAHMTWSELLQKLRNRYGRPVSFMYEADDRPYTVKDEIDFKMCWDSVDQMHQKTRQPGQKPGPSASLAVFIVDMDPSKFAQSTRKTAGAGGRQRSALSPKKITRPESDRMPGRHDEGELRRSRTGASMDFESRHKWIDDLMKKLSVGGIEPTTLRGKWDRVLSECGKRDVTRAHALSQEEFGRVLKVVEPKMTREQVSWFVRDADKNAAGEVLYSKYCEAKKGGRGPLERHGLEDSKILATETKINSAIKLKFRSLQQAFKKMNVNKDGMLSKEEFQRGLEERLKIKLGPRMLNAVFDRIDANSDGSLDYEEFLHHFRRLPTTDSEGGELKEHSNLDLCKLLLQSFGSMNDSFEQLDTDKDGRLSREEIYEGLRSIGIRMNMERLKQFLYETDQDKDGFVDYREFLRMVSQTTMSDIRGSGVDELSREEARVRDRIREQFADAKQAFHCFDRDGDGRLSMQEFDAGIASLFPASDPLKGPLRQKLFRRADGDGDLFLSFHEFLACFGVRPQMRKAQKEDERIRMALRKKYPWSVMEAFRKLDLDGDDRLSRDDLMVGLQRELDIALEPEVLDALMERVDLDRDNYIDFHEFLVRFGLDFKADGRWVYKEEGAKKDDKPKDPPEVALFKRLLKSSRWHGRGGVEETLCRFDPRYRALVAQQAGPQSEEARASARAEVALGLKEFSAALKEGLGMESLSSEDIELLAGKAGGKPYFDKKRKVVKASQFVKDMVNKFMQRELTLFRVLLVDNRWHDLRAALQSFDVAAGPAGKTVVTKQDFESALQRVVEQSKEERRKRGNVASVVSDDDRKLILEKVKADALHEKDGPMAGGIDYELNFFHHYIPQEMRLYALLSPCWEDIASRFLTLAGRPQPQGGEEEARDARDATLSYKQLRELCRQCPLAEPLGARDLDVLVDLLDPGGRGEVSLAQLRRLYGREQAQLLQAVREQWHPLLQHFHKARPPGTASKTLQRSQFQQALVAAAENGKLSGLSMDQLGAIVGSLPAKLLNEKGEVKYEDWVAEYAGDYLAVHAAFQGNHTSSKLPLWDVVVACFHLLEQNRGAVSGGQEGLVSWEEFRRTLARAGIELQGPKLLRLLDDLDPDMSGAVDWRAFVDGPAQGRCRLYFFNGRPARQMRDELQKVWWRLLSLCEAAEKTDGKIKEKRPAAKVKAVLAKSSFEGCLKQAVQAGRAEMSAEDVHSLPKEEQVLALGVKMAQDAFAEVDGVKHKSLGGEPMLDYVAFVKNFAGANFTVESYIRRKWENMLTVFKSMDPGSREEISREQLEQALARPELGLTKPMIDFVLRDVRGEPVAYLDLCWAIAGKDILAAISTKCLLVLKGCRKVDKARTEVLPAEAFRSVLVSESAGFSAFQVDLLLRQMRLANPETWDLGVRYDELLSGKMQGLKVESKVYGAWKAMEQHWKVVVERFLSFDTDYDGEVTDKEFREGLLQMKPPVAGLTEKDAVEAIFKELDPGQSNKLDLEDFMWRMARDTLEDAMAKCGVELVRALRKEGDRLADKHGGKVPKKEAEAVVAKTTAGSGLDKVQVTVLLRRMVDEGSKRQAAAAAAAGTAVPPPAKGKGKEQMIAQEDAVAVVRELAEGRVNGEDLAALHAVLGELLHDALQPTQDRWVDAVEQTEKQAPKEFQGVWMHKEVAGLALVGQESLKRHHMHKYLAAEQPLVQGKENTAVGGMRASAALQTVGERREAEVLRGGPWKAYWQESARRHASMGGAGGAGGGAAAGESKVLSKAQEKVRKGVSERRREAEEVLARLDVDRNGVISDSELRKGLRELDVGLSTEELEAIVAEEAKAGGYMLYAEFVDKYVSGRVDLATLAAQREERGVYRRLKQNLDSKDESWEGSFALDATSAFLPGSLGGSAAQNWV